MERLVIWAFLPRFRASLMLLSLLAVTAPLNTAAQGRETLVMPQELVEHAQQNGCRQVADFFERPAMVNPPYAYGYLPGSPENSAVYWCEKGRQEPKDERTYVLMFMFKGERPAWARCPARIIEWRNYPAGLSFLRDRTLTLEHFESVEQPKRRGSKAVRLQHPAIRNEYDGLEEIFYCHDGRWFVWMRD